MSKKKNNSESSVESLDKIIDNTFEKLKNIIDANTTVGSIIKLTDKMFVIPISKVSVGLISGGGEMPLKKKNAGMTAGSTTGFAVTPVGFVVVNDKSIDYISASQVETSTSKVFETIMNISEKLLNRQGVSNEED